MINDFIDKCIEHPRFQVENFIAFFKLRNYYREYSVDRLNDIYIHHIDNCYDYKDFDSIYKLFDDKSELVDYINNIHTEIELDIFTPDHEYSPKHTFVMKSKMANTSSDIIHICVYSKNGLIKAYTIPAVNISMEDIANIVDKEIENK